MCPSTERLILYSPFKSLDKNTHIKPTHTHHNLLYRNMMFGTSLHNQYEGWLAPGVRDALWEARHCKKNCEEEWEGVKQQLSILQYVVNSAVINLKDFMYL
ncbi:N-acetylated-alpha-linked acidic dipeptidase 2 [Portunus trituberculatus]|uniref:N-acetylated-alpha-linked acidic dipeptidase 2 n=1 Tax=Portunus trituberculatus TaxID=210409 RepID=A0A5B7GHT3_PORTR|nr:N-acetylated-alpha-linked acidic dipeptidase 2 [Portunus trituberculatus]